MGKKQSKDKGLDPAEIGYVQDSDSDDYDPQNAQLEEEQLVQLAI